MTNRLSQETSPYLLQHQHNPVDWWPWGSDAFAFAKAANKPVLLSVGYAACHWCHVMAHESFENAGIASLMNDLFVSIKVDREERPDVDHIYQSALAMLGQSGGWPLTMFLTPEGQPFWGGTYFPPEARWGRPGFPDILRGVADTFQRERHKVTQNVELLKQGLERLSRSQPGIGIDNQLLDQVAHRLEKEFDPTWGGIGTGPKFPQTAVLQLLWRAWLRTGHTKLGTAVTHTLTCMAQGGIYDHLGGGFSRYSVDDQWLVPHFEKMLYDNALLIELLTLIWQQTSNGLFRDRVAETIAWVLSEMTVEGGGFASSLDADSEGEEGRYYVWTVQDIDQQLGTASTAFKQAYDVTATGNWEGTNILNRRNGHLPRSETSEAALADARQILLAARGKRQRPGWDDKVLVDWNGLMIAALAEAGFVFDRPEWVAAATRAFDFIVSNLHDPAKPGHLLHSWRDGKAQHAGLLDDHASMAQAALALFETTGSNRFLVQALAWVQVAETAFGGSEDGGYFMTQADETTLCIRPRSGYDGATPSGNATLAGVLARLYHLTGDDGLRIRAQKVITAFSGEIERNFFPLCSLMNAASCLQNAVVIVIIGAADHPQTNALLRVVASCSLPDRVLLRLPSTDHIGPGHPAFGKAVPKEGATAFVCQGTTCSLPQADPEGLRALLVPLAAA